MSEMTLEEKLEQYAKSDTYPFHMPGHKRQVKMKEDVYQYDITEIQDFDNLYEANGILLQIKELARELYHSKESYLLVGGSTVGNLVSIFAATSRGDEIIVGRNSHKSVYHAAMLRELKVHYIRPAVSDLGIVMRTPVEEYARAIKETPGARAIVVTSPTYEGIIEDIEEIAKLAHAHGMMLIVDAAHGAHLGACEKLATNPVEQGADLVVMSLHKTMPSLTQTGLLHVGMDSKISTEKVARYLEMFQTSSPSYVLMTSIEQALIYRRDHQHEFSDYVLRMESFFEKCKAFHYLKVAHLPYQDISKVVIDTSHTTWTGYDVMSMLREDFSLELEMASFSYCLAMTSVMDTNQGFERLFAALLALDSQAEPAVKKDLALQELYAPSEKVMEMQEAFDARARCVALSCATGEIAARNVSLYPPGVPVFVPGERITTNKIELLEQADQKGLTITGFDGKKVRVVE